MTGMIHLIIWIIIGILALSFFGISLRSIVESPASQDNFSYFFMLVQQGWDYIVAWFETAKDLIFWWE